MIGKEKSELKTTVISGFCIIVIVEYKLVVLGSVGVSWVSWVEGVLAIFVPATYLNLPLTVGILNSKANGLSLYLQHN